MEGPPDSSAAHGEGLELAKYLLPPARTLLRSNPALAARVADDYARALQRHRRPTLSHALCEGRSIDAVDLWAWEGAAAPEPGRSLVRQHLLLTSAILESQPELAPYFLPGDVSRPRVVWRLVTAITGTAVAWAFSLRLRLRPTRRKTSEA
jgi:hypothetical protein